MKLKKKYVKLIKLIIFIIIVILLIMLIHNSIKTKHNIKYKINNYNIEENFLVKNNKHYYSLKISDKKNIFIYTNNVNYHKRKKIIKKIINHNNCIMPIYKDKSNGEVLCNYNNEITSLYYIKIDNNKNYNKIVKKFKKDGYDIKINNSEKVNKYKKLLIYKDNISNNETYTLWNYKGLYVIKNNEFKYKKLLKEDKYENDLASLVGKYYVFVDTNNKYNGFKLYYYDIEKDKIQIFDKTKYKIDDDIYFSGIYDNKLYIYDKRYKNQYRFDPYKDELKKVGNKAKGFYLLKNNELELVNYYEFKEIIYFNTVNDEKVNKLYDVKDIYLINDYYYIYSNDGYFYKVYKNDIKRSIKLFKIDNIKSFIIRNNKIIILLEDNLYIYNSYNGLKNIINYEELKYNYNNIYDYYEKN